MPDSHEMSHSPQPQAGDLNEPQRMRLKTSCQYMDKLLGDIEQILHAAASRSPFPRYIVDMSPSQIRVMEDYIGRIRAQLLRTIAWQHMAPDAPNIRATFAILTHLSFVDIAVEELRPQHMKGSGAVPPEAVDELNGVVFELRSLLTEAERFLKQEQVTDLAERLKKLEANGADVSLLQRIEQIVTRHGLVEFRSRLATLTARLSDESFEVAVFGRVSAGKSSLLNALLETSVLPVGIMPITAVPTRIRYGEQLAAGVAFGDGQQKDVTIEELATLVTELGNPGNLKNIVRAVIEIPSPRLEGGIMLVDTPGLGSLAKRGAAETLAYLPSCDLALLLIDAGATLTEEDLGTLRLLYEAGIPSLVLLSKADLLASGDLHRAVTYIEEQIQHDLKLNLHVHAVSSLPSHKIMLDHFYERELLPRFEQARALKTASVARKIGALREAVLAALKVSLAQLDRKQSAPGAEDATLETELRTLTGQIGEQRQQLSRTFREMGERPSVVLEQMTEKALAWSHNQEQKQVPALLLAEWAHDAVWNLVHSPIEQLRSIGQHAVDALQSIAGQLGGVDAPSRQDFELLLRDMPRFEMASLPAEISIGRWSLLGQTVLRSRIRAQIEENIGEVLSHELRLYGLSLSDWSEHVVDRIQVFLNSYADTYRALLQRRSGVAGQTAQPDKLKQDIDQLERYTPGTTDPTQK